MYGKTDKSKNAYIVLSCHVEPPGRRNSIPEENASNEDDRLEAEKHDYASSSKNKGKNSSRVRKDIPQVPSTFYRFWGLYSNWAARGLLRCIFDHETTRFVWSMQSDSHYYGQVIKWRTKIYRCKCCISGVSQNETSSQSKWHIKVHVRKCQDHVSRRRRIWKHRKTRNFSWCCLSRVQR